MMHHHAYRASMGLNFCHDPLTAMTAVSAVVSAAGTVVGGIGAKNAGDAARDSKYFEAGQLEQAAQESRAASQRSMLEKRREGTLLQSKLQARAAASGAGAADPTVVDLGGDIAQRSSYEGLMEVYKGENRARGLEDQAIGSRMSGDAAAAEGKAKRSASFLSAAGTILGGATSAYKLANRLPYSPGSLDDYMMRRGGL